MLARFYPRDAVLARVLALAHCPSLPVSVTSRCSIEMDGRIDLLLTWRLLSTGPTPYNKEVQVSRKNKGTSLGNFAPNSGFRKFRHCISIVEACYKLSSRKVHAQIVINWTVVGQLKAKFHYTGPTGPTRTRTDFVGDPHGPNGISRRPGPQKSPCGSGWARVVEFSSKLIIPPSSDAGQL